jgi:hypothetical protein
MCNEISKALKPPEVKVCAILLERLSEKEIKEALSL